MGRGGGRGALLGLDYEEPTRREGGKRRKLPAVGKASYKYMAMKASQLKVKAAQTKHGKL